MRDLAVKSVRTLTSDSARKQAKPCTHHHGHTQIFNAPQPDLSYFKDPNQNPAGDLLKGFTPEGTSVGSVQGPDFITYAPCLVR